MSRLSRTLVRAAGVALMAAIVLGGRARGDAPARVAFVIDTSGSLTEGDLARTRSLAAAILGALPEGSEAAVLTFADESRLVLPFTTSAPEVRRALDSAAISGRFTALYDALYDASRYLRDAPAGRRAIVLVTDGKDENSALDLDDALKVAQATQIPVFAVGVGRVQERVLRRIAKLTGGEYVPVGQAEASPLVSAILATAPPTGPAPAAPTAAPPRAAPPAPLPPPLAAPEARSPLALWGLLALATGAAAVLGFLGLRRRRSARCPTCGRALAGPLARCAFCAADPSAATMIAGADLADGPSPTVLERMDETEEYLERTVVLEDQPALAVIEGPAAGLVFNLSRTAATSLGRAKVNDIVLDDVSVSSQHCRVRPEDGRFVVHDLKSTNGTFVNERRIKSHPLSEGDVLRVGETRMRFRTSQKRG